MMTATICQLLQVILYATVAASSLSDTQIPLANGLSTDIITGVYGEDPEIKILSDDGRINWKLSVNDILEGHPNLVPWLRDCWSNGSAVTEMKQISDGTKIAALIGEAAVVINYMPENSEEDKKVVYGVCVNIPNLSNCHTLEALPSDTLAIATSGQRQSDGIWLYDAGRGLVPDGSPEPFQKGGCHPTIHGMVWDDEKGILWAAGTDKAADGSECRAYGLLNGYQWSKEHHYLDKDSVNSYRMPTTAQCFTEWPSDDPNSKYWDGPHDVAPVPNERKLLVSTELDIHEFDFDSERFTAGEAVEATYLKGFVPLGNRTGTNKFGQPEYLPRSDLKSVSLAEDDRVVYNQAIWATTFSSRLINVLENGNNRGIDVDGSIYKARWLDSTPGWRRAEWSL
ncbi:uncharacterized protein BO87DRAFT_450649 [Aspergillus neoniger CBS 115656]|uniref:Uncharacterized protein n=1 Tax=Aspergillus neoniger (strain CBS 115656) TaxID=1448310 RepID=A0A318YSY1_ASPNB|nr:hypothetical protein BO87DRAFT_450649 [Aspergillus neoniger CBS 115656]PYH37506.1 hypothetical protein BO87DRAFT_450649 [Aspergillus neoniger CBS 115656]